jgi:uncharacterized protein
MKTRPRKWLVVACCGLLCVALVLLGIVVRNRTFDAAALATAEEDYPAAVKRFRVLAALGDSSAQYFLGELYAFGLGVPKDEEKAIEFFRRSSKWSSGGDKSAAASMYHVGERYLGRRGIARDTEAARRWFERSASEGYTKAADELSRLKGQTSH